MTSRGERELQCRFGTERRASAFYDKQVLSKLNQLMRDYLGRQEMMFVSTSDAHGNCDSSFRAGLPGFVRVLDDERVMYPEYRGNGVMASLGNISENPHIGLLFLDFFESAVGLHINGRAEIVENDQVATLPGITQENVRELQLDMLAADGRAPERWVLVHIDEAYIHCSKHVPLLRKLDKKLDWGTDEFKKGGDFFRTRDA